MNRSRRPLIAGNWKMNHGGLDGVELAMACAALAKKVPQVELVIAPPFTALAAAAHECDGSGVGIAAQNMHEKPNGAFTGEISAPMLKESGATWVILGHSERRQYFAETNEIVTAKLSAALHADLKPIVCVGETLGQREAGKALATVESQLLGILPLLARAPGETAIAYEPVWAIGTGKTAGPKEAEEVHAFIRGLLKSAKAALDERVRVLYGGSLKPENANELLSCPNIDGGLIGGASLDVGSFGAIAHVAQLLTA